MGLRSFERRLEHLVEGTFARVFKSGLTPLEMGRRIVREIDANQSVGVDGAIAVPNHYWVYLSTADHERFADVSTTLTDELSGAARDHIRDERYRLLGPIAVTLVEASDYPEGSFQVQAQWREGTLPYTRAVLTLSDGQRIDLTNATFTIGRATDSSLILVDEGASRHHAQLRPSGFAWILTDLNSTNGTTVNGARITDHELADGDLISFASTRVTFELG